MLQSKALKYHLRASENDPVINESRAWKRVVHIYDAGLSNLDFELSLVFKFWGFQNDHKCTHTQPKNHFETAYPNDTFQNSISLKK